MSHETREADRRFEELCNEVRRQCGRIYGAAGNGNAEKAADLALALSDYVSTVKQSRLMQLERAGGYDLSALQVHADTQSNSETGWERDDD
jgi:hypothetical protein